MAFKIAVAEIIKIAAIAGRYTSLLESGKVVEGLVRSYLVKAVRDGLVNSGIPLDQVDFQAQATIWADLALIEAGAHLAAPSVVVARDKFLADLSDQVDRLLDGKAVGNGLPPTGNQTRVADPVVLYRGEFERRVIDFEVSGAGMDFAFRRSYRSGAAYRGPLGANWDHSYNLRLIEENEVVLVRLTGELAEDRFVQHPRFGEAEFSYYAPPDGIHDVIVPDGAGSFMMKRPRGTTFRYEPAPQPGEHRIRRIDDRFGNGLDFEYSSEDRVEHVFVNAASRYVSLIYDELGRLDRLEDHTGRSVVYTYDDWGYLDCAAGPALTGEQPVSRERYEYEYVGNTRKLVRVWDWNDRIIVENEYDSDQLSDSFGYVIRQTEHLGETTFVYEPIREVSDPTLSSRDIPTLRVWESRRNGHQVEHVFNESGNELLTREAFAEGCRMREVVTRLRYNADGQLIARLNPDGALMQFLFSRDHLADSIPWPDMDPVLGDIPVRDRMSFGNLLATVTRGHRVAADADDPEFWGQIPSVKMPDDPNDVVMKYRYDRDSQLLTSTSDPRHTASADPLHVESSNPGDPNFNPGEQQFIDHQRHLTSTEYGPAPRFELRRTIFPDRTRPSPLDGVTSVTGVVDEIRQYDANGRPLERLDTRGYEWFSEYYPPSLDPELRAKEGFLHRRLIPHLDLALDEDSPDVLEIQRTGQWQVGEDFALSSGEVSDKIALSVEGVRIALYQSHDDLTKIASTHPQVLISVDGIPQSPWNQSLHAIYLVANLARGVHLIELNDSIGIPFAIGRVRSHVSVEYEVDDLGRTVQETDPLGHPTVNVVDVLGRKIKVTRGPAANPSVVHSEYDAGGRLILERAAWRDETGQNRPEGAVVRRYHYDQAHLLLAESVGPEQKGAQRLSRYHYDAEGNLLETVSPRGNRTYFDYDALNRQIRTVRAACTKDRSITTTAYDLADRVLVQRNPRGARRVSGYLDAGGKLRSGIDTRGRVWVRTDPLGHMVVTDYNAMDRPTIVRQFQRRTDGQCELLSRRMTDYDEHGDAVRATDAVFEEPILTADPVHVPDSEFLAAVNAGDVQNATTENHLDASGNIIAVRNPVGGIQRQRFDGQGRPYEQVDPGGRRTLRIYDGNGNALRIYAFEPVHEPVSGDILHYEVFVESHEYDELNREVARGDSYGSRWQIRYDSLGRKTVTTDPLGNTVRLDYDAFGGEVTRTQERTQTGIGGAFPLPALVTRREHDEAGNVIAIVDPLERRTEFTFDGLDRLIESRFAVDPSEPKELRTYDHADNLASLTDRNGLVRTMQYDLLDRHIRTDIDASGVAPPNALSPLSATFASFMYDAAGNQIYHENDYCVVEVRRDSRGLSISEAVSLQNIAGAPSLLEIGQGFDLAGRLTKLVYPSGREISYSRDLLGRVTAVHNVSSPVDYPGKVANAASFDLAHYTYVGRRLVGVALGNGLTLALRFDGRGHVLERAVTGNTGPLWRLQELRDAAGYARLESSTTRTGARSRKAALDSIYRLTHYTDTDVQWIDADLLAPAYAPVDPAQTNAQSVIDAAIGQLALPPGPPAFEYDDMGSRLETREPGLTSVSSTPNDLNQYIQVGGHLWQHDANGNLRSDGVHTVAYDMNDALQEITDDATGTTLASYYRDAVGRVVAETTPVSTVYRIHKDSFPLLEVAATGRREFTEGHQPGAVFHAAMAGEDYWCLYDGLNSMRLLTNASGNLVAVPVYRPYGVAEDNELALSPLRFGFASMWYTPDLPFYHSERRSYYPAVGRHLQRDPAGLVDDVNLYTYVGNNPTNYVDPTGTKIVLPSDEDARLRVLRGLQELTDDLLGMRKSKSGEYQVEVVATAQFPPGDKPDRPVGTLLVGSLIDSEQTITIDLGGSSETNRAGPRGRDAKITWGSKEVLVTGEGEASKLTETPAYISLGHELIHALRITEGRVAPAYALEHEFLDPRGRKVIETATLEELIVSGILTPEKKGKTGSLNLLRGNLLGGTVASDRLIRALEALVAKDRIKGSTITENTLREEHHLPLRIAYTSYTRLGELPELITH